MSDHLDTSRTRNASLCPARPLVITVALAVVALSASTAWAGDQAKHDLFKRIQERVLRYTFFAVFDNVEVAIGEDGFVTLSGRVTGPHKQRALEQRVAALDGVTAVANEIAVLPVSRFDDQLRYRVARAIYGNSTFWHYAARAHPSIHIVVERGHVALTGVVDSETDRHLALVLARQFNAFSVTNKLKLPAEVTADRERLG